MTRSFLVFISLKHTRSISKGTAVLLSSSQILDLLLPYQKQHIIDRPPNRYCYACFQTTLKEQNYLPHTACNKVRFLNRNVEL